MTEPVFADNPAANRYELREGDKVIAFAEYRLRGQRMTFTHTEVEKSLEGRGLGTRLARDAVEDAQRRHLQVVPACPFIAAYMAKHPSAA